MRNSKTLFVAVAAALSVAFLSPAHAQQSQQGPSAQPGARGGDKAVRDDAKSAKRDKQNNVDSGDRRFMTRAAQMGLAEVAASRVAMEKASSPEVKKFAEHMVKEHEKSNAELKQIASGKGVSLPTTPDAKHQDAVKDLRGMSGDKFDHQYLERAGVKDHKTVLDLFQDGAKKARDPELKAFFEKHVPHIKHHLAMAQDLAEQADGGDAKQRDGDGSAKKSDREGAAASK